MLALDERADESVADIYNQAGDDYVAYADGDPTQPFAFDGMHAYADRCVWAVMETKLADLRASGASAVSFLDAGCGPGTWLRRLVIRARALGFSSITARGFDIAQAQIQRARLAARNLSSLPGVNLTFDVADLTGRLPEADALGLDDLLAARIGQLAVADQESEATGIEIGLVHGGDAVDHAGNAEGVVIAAPLLGRYRETGGDGAVDVGEFIGLRRRSQKDWTTWERVKRLADDWQDYG